MLVFNSMDDALASTVKTLLAEGTRTAPRQRSTVELLGYAFRLTNPRARIICTPSRKWSFSFAVGELCWHLSGHNDLDIIAYYSKKWLNYSRDGQTIASSCYGNKIFSSSASTTSQWNCLKELITIDVDTRRAVINLLPQINISSIEDPDISCIASIQFLLRGNKLNCITTMRSNDVILGMCYDVFFVTMLQEMLSVELGVELGWYQHSVGSMHLYDENKEMALAIAKEPGTLDSPPMIKMTETSSIERFLQIETMLRTGDRQAILKIKQLPTYWAQLAKPLEAKASRVHQWESPSPCPPSIPT